MGYSRRLAKSGYDRHNLTYRGRLPREPGVDAFATLNSQRRDSTLVHCRRISGYLLRANIMGQWLRIILLALLGLVLGARPSVADPWSRKGYVLGEVLSGGTTYGFIDMGYAHRVKPFQQVAIFRSRNKVYHPLGVFRLERVDATKSVVHQLKETPVRTGDIVVALERDLVPLEQGNFLEDHFVRTHIVNRRQSNRYDTGLGSQTANAFKIQSHEVRNRRSQAWEEGFKRTTIEKREIESDVRRALILQLEFFRTEIKTSPRSFAPISREWKQVLILLDPKVGLSQMAPTISDNRVQAAADAFAPELDDEAAQFFRVLIARGLMSPVNQEAAIRAALMNSQFGLLSNDDRLPKALATFIQEYAAANAPADVGMGQ